MPVINDQRSYYGAPQGIWPVYEGRAWDGLSGGWSALCTGVRGQDDHYVGRGGGAWGCYGPNRKMAFEYG